jgi:hypothetical protein
MVNIQKILLLILLNITIATFVFAQNDPTEDKNCITLNLIPFYQHTAEISYQRYIFNNQSLIIKLSYTERNNEVFPKSGQGLEIQYRFGINNRSKIQYFIAPFYQIKQIAADNPFSPCVYCPPGQMGVTIGSRSNFIGAILGCSLVLKRKFYIEFYSGIGIKFSKLSYFIGDTNYQNFYDDIGYYNGPAFNTGLSLGYKF